MRTKPIVVGTDLSSGSERAVEHALGVARRTGADLILVHAGVVVDQPTDLPASMQATATAWRAVLAQRLAQDRAELGDLRQRVSGQGVEVSQLVVDGFADTGLAEAARELDARLVVVGTHGRTGFKRLLLGSVAEQTVRGAPCSVLVARGDAPAGGYRRVVVGTDFSAQAMVAVEQAYAYAAPDAELRVVHASSMPYAIAEVSGELLAQVREGTEATAAALQEELRARPHPPGVSIRVEVVFGTPAAVLDDLSGCADLVVVGSHGRRGVRRFLLGSTAEATVRHARCSVLVAR